MPSVWSLTLRFFNGKTTHAAIFHESMYGAFFRGTAFPNQTSLVRAAKLWCFRVDTMLTLVNVRHNGVVVPPPWGGGGWFVLFGKW